MSFGAHTWRCSDLKQVLYRTCIDCLNQREPLNFDISVACHQGGLKNFVGINVEDKNLQNYKRKVSTCTRLTFHTHCLNFLPFLTESTFDWSKVLPVVHIANFSLISCSLNQYVQKEQRN